MDIQVASKIENVEHFYIILQLHIEAMNFSELAQSALICSNYYIFCIAHQPFYSLKNMNVIAICQKHHDRGYRGPWPPNFFKIVGFFEI